MNHTCTHQTDLDELIGTDCIDGQHVAFHYGPLALAMKRGEELVLDNSQQLSLLLRAKLPMLLESLRIEETREVIEPGAGFRVTLR